MLNFEEELEERKRFRQFTKREGPYHTGYNDGIIDTLERLQKCYSEAYPQATEDNEYRYISPAWLDDIAKGLTAGAVKHPGETWRTIPTDEHIARAIRHLNLARMGDKEDKHLINAAMRCMMAYETEGK